MPYIRLGKEREALHGRSEQYKRSAIEYLQNRGYVLDKDSLIEGTFDDMVYLTKSGMRISVECKDTDLSITEAEFLIPFGIYLAEYANSPMKTRFNFVFCVRSFKDSDLVERVFGKVRDNTAAMMLFGKTAMALAKDGKEKSLRAANILKSIDEKIVLSFIENSEVIEGSYSDFERAASEWENSRGSTFLTSLISKDEFVKSFERSASPDKCKETLASNILKVTSLPDFVYFAQTRYRYPINILKKLDYEAFPFILKEKQLYTFSNLDENDNPLRDVVQKASISNHRTMDAFESVDRQFWLTDILNRCVEETLFSRGLRRRGKRPGVFVFVSYEGEDVRVKWNPGTGQIMRTFTKCKIREDGTIAYCVHKALRASFKKIGYYYYLTLNPGFYFTKDGKEPLSHLKMSEFSGRAWAYHGNQKLLYDIRFWVNFLSRGREIIEIDTGGQPIVVETLYSTVQTAFGINDDISGNPHLLTPIRFSMTNPFRAAPSRQTELGDFLELDEVDIMDMPELEEFDDEWD